MVYCFDIDGTICSNTNGRYDEAEPLHGVIQLVNALYEKNHTIYFYTARGSTTGLDWEAKTKAQLKNWGVKYHELFFGKPTADIYIDDKCINIAEWIKSGGHETNK